MSIRFYDSLISRLCCFVACTRPSNQTLFIFYTISSAFNLKTFSSFLHRALTTTTKNISFYFSVYATKISTTLNCYHYCIAHNRHDDDDNDDVDEDDSNIDVMRITYSNFHIVKATSYTHHTHMSQSSSDCKQNANYYYYYALQ